MLITPPLVTSASARRSIAFGDGCPERLDDRGLDMMSLRRFIYGSGMVLAFIRLPTEATQWSSGVHDAARSARTKRSEAKSPSVSIKEVWVPNHRFSARCSHRFSARCNHHYST